MASVEPKNVAQFIEHDELINYLPHKGKMFLLSRVTQHDVEKHTITSEYEIVFFMRKNLTEFRPGQVLSLWRREFLLLQELQIKSRGARRFLE